MQAGHQCLVERGDFQRLLDALTARLYRIIGPTIRDAAIVYDTIASVDDLPAGWTDEQKPGSYRLRRRDDAALFGHVVGPHSWKQFLFPPRALLWKATRERDGFRISTPPVDETRLAFLGVRSCELRAIAIQDRIFMEVDPLYRARRERALLIAVNCAAAGGTCFCASMETGPRALSGFDLALTELTGAADGGGHRFVVEVGSDRGGDVMESVPHREVGAEDADAADRLYRRAAGRMGRSIDTVDIRELLYQNYENPRWDDAARRCLTCGNCTLACPTCFCSTVEDATDLTGAHAERRRRWDSCFTLDFTFIHGGSMRPAARSRYRHWVMHKLAAWFDQYGTSGCVGCGRCITWCPAGIDITEEAGAIRRSERTHGDT